MKRTSLLISIILLCFLANSGVCAEFAGGTSLVERRNPFKPQLPKKEVKKEPQKVKLTPPPQRKDVRRTSRVTKAKETIEEEIIQPPPLSITGLIWNTDRPQAIINNQVVDVGDTVDTTKIVAIRKTGIDILVQGRKMTITP